MRVVITSDKVGCPDVRCALRPLREDVLGVGLECEAEDCVVLSDLPARLARDRADVVLVLLGDDPASDLAEARTCAGARTPVLAVGPPVDPMRLLQVIRGGAFEYLNVNTLRDDLMTTLGALRQLGVVGGNRGRAVALTSALAGSGVTTVAAGIAFALAKGKGAKSRVALAELGAGPPGLGLALNLVPLHTVNDVARRHDRADAMLVRQAMIKHEDGVSLLLQDPDAADLPPIDPKPLRGLVVLLKAMFAESVLDLGYAADLTALDALRMADEVLVVTRLDVPSLKRTRAYLRRLEDRGVGSVSVVANRYGQRGQIPWRVAEESLGRPVTAWLPDDPAALNATLNLGQPFVRAARRSAAARGFDRLARWYADPARINAQRERTR